MVSGIGMSEWMNQRALGFQPLLPQKVLEQDETIGLIVPDVDSESAHTPAEYIGELAVMEAQAPGRRASVLEATRAFKDMLQTVQGVEAVLATQETGGVSLAVVVNNASREHRREIHNCEWGLMQRYLGMGFDFRIIDRRDRPLCDIVSIELSDVYLRA